IRGAPSTPGARPDTRPREGAAPVISAEKATDLRFEPPGPGSWELERVHFPRPVTRYWSELHPAPFRRGFSEFTRYYGMLLDTLDYAYVNGFAYNTARPVAQDEAPRPFQRSEDPKSAE